MSVDQGAGGFFMITKPDRRRCSTRRSAVMRAIASSAVWMRLRPGSAARKRSTAGRHRGQRGSGACRRAWPSLARGRERIKNSAQLRTAARHVRGSRCGGSRAKQLREPLRLPRFQHQCGASPYKSHVFCHEMPTAPTRRLDRLSKRLPWLVRRYRSWFHPHTDVFPFGRFAPAGAVQS